MTRSYELAMKLLKELKLEVTSGIEFQQFLVTCCDKEKILNDEALRASFEMWDIEGKGSINLNDIKKVVRNGRCFLREISILFLRQRIHSKTFFWNWD